MFNIIGKIKNVYDTKIKLLVDDINIEKTNDILKKLKRDALCYNEINIDIKFANIYINHINWNSINDLIGVRVIILCKPKYYCYTTPLPSSSVDEKLNFVTHRGVTIVAVSIKNYNDR